MTWFWWLDLFWIVFLVALWKHTRFEFVRRRAARERMRLAMLQEVIADDDELEGITRWACHCDASFTCTAHLAMRELDDRRRARGATRS